MELKKGFETAVLEKSGMALILGLKNQTKTKSSATETKATPENTSTLNKENKPLLEGCEVAEGVAVLYVELHEGEEEPKRLYVGLKHEENEGR